MLVEQEHVNSRRQDGTTTTDLEPARSLSTLVAKETPTISSAWRPARRAVSSEHAASVNLYQAGSRLAMTTKDTTGSKDALINLSVSHS